MRTPNLAIRAAAAILAGGAALVASSPAWAGQTLPQDTPRQVEAGTSSKDKLARLVSQDKRVGVEASAYTGKYFRKEQEQRRKCIVERESSGYYNVVSPSGSYYGAYQVSKELAVGASWMLVDEHKDILGPDLAKKTLADLRDTPFNKWPRYWQDAAFWTVYNWDGTGSGAKHWKGGRWTC